MPLPHAIEMTNDLSQMPSQRIAVFNTYDEAVRACVEGFTYIEPDADRKYHAKQMEPWTVNRRIGSSVWLRDSATSIRPQVPFIREWEVTFQAPNEDWLYYRTNYPMTFAQVIADALQRGESGRYHGATLLRIEAITRD